MIIAALLDTVPWLQFVKPKLNPALVTACVILPVIEWFLNVVIVCEVQRFDHVVSTLSSISWSHNERSVFKLVIVTQLTQVKGGNL